MHNSKRFAISIRWLLAVGAGAALFVLPSCSSETGEPQQKVAVTISEDDSPYDIEAKLFRLPEGLRHLDHVTYSLNMGKDGYLYLGVGDNVSNGNLLRFDPATERITDLGDFKSKLPDSIREKGNYGKFHVGPHQMADGSVYFASYPREYWQGPQAGRLYKYTETGGIVDLGPTPNNEGVYYMHGDDTYNKLYLANHDSHFTIYDITTGTWEDKGRFTSKPPFIGLTDQAGRLYIYSYDGKGNFVPGPSTITRYDPLTNTLETSKNAPPTLWVGAATPDHVTAYTTTYLDADLFSWRFDEWPNYQATNHGRMDPRGRPIFANNLSLTQDKKRLVVAGTIESKDNWHLGNVHGVWIYDIESGRKYLAAKLNDALTSSFGKRAGRMKFYWTNADNRDKNGWIYVALHIDSIPDSEARLLAMRVHSKSRR